MFNTQSHYYALLPQLLLLESQLSQFIQATVATTTFVAKFVLNLIADDRTGNACFQIPTKKQTNRGGII